MFWIKLLLTACLHIFHIQSCDVGQSETLANNWYLEHVVVNLCDN